jgi:hypothetical protein
MLTFDEQVDVSTCRLVELAQHVAWFGDSYRHADFNLIVLAVQRRGCRSEGMLKESKDTHPWLIL